MLILECLSPKDLIRVQVACRLWYDDKIPLLIESMQSQFGSTLRKVNKLLSFTPRLAGKDAMELYLKMPMTQLALFQKYWNLVESNYSMLDYANSRYEIWQEDFCGQRYQCHGMKHKVSGLRHGIVRWVMPGQWISEATYRNGERHGLMRDIYPKRVSISLFKYDGLRASLKFNCDL